MEFGIAALALGIGATALLDLWGLARARLSGTPLPDYALVGRWIAYMPRGRFVHRPIKASAALPHEALIGWTAHYLIGIAFAAVLLAGFGLSWLRAPCLGGAMLVGMGSVAAPFALMQPGMGLGIAARATPDPRAARIRSLTTHAIFGVGLYVSGWAVHFMMA